MTHVLSDDNFSGIFGEKGYSFIAERMNGVVQGGSRLLLVPILLVLSVVGSVFDLVVHSVVFLSALYYLLSAEVSVEEFLHQFLAPVDRNGRMVQTFSATVRRILLSALRMCIFFSLFTWLIYGFLDMPVVYVPTLAAGLIALVPVVDPVIVPIMAPFYQLVLGNFYLAVIGFTANGIIWWFVTTAIYAEIPDSNPWLAAFSVALGINAFGVKGVLIGPLVAAVPIVSYQLITSFNRQNIEDEKSPAPTTGTRLSSAEREDIMNEWSTVAAMRDLINAGDVDAVMEAVHAVSGSTKSRKKKRPRSTSDSRRLLRTHTPPIYSRGYSRRSRGNSDALSVAEYAQRDRFVSAEDVEPPTFEATSASPSPMYARPHRLSFSTEPPELLTPGRDAEVVSEEDSGLEADGAAPAPAIRVVGCGSDDDEDAFEDTVDPGDAEAVEEAALFARSTSAIETAGADTDAFDEALEPREHDPPGDNQEN
jgi:hypothetical protein